MFDRIIERFNELKELMKRIKELEKSVDLLKKELEKEEKNRIKAVEELERINKYYIEAKPKVRINTHVDFGHWYSLCATMFIYVHGTEYEVNVDNCELASIYTECNRKFDYDIRDGGVAYVTFRNDKKKCTYKYIVDYHNNKYVMTVEEDPIQEVYNE